MQFLTRGDNKVYSFILVFFKHAGILTIPFAIELYKISVKKKKHLLNFISQQCHCYNLIPYK